MTPADNPVSNISVLDPVEVIAADTPEGKLVKGAKAFLIAWSNIPKLNFLYKVFSLPIFYHFFAIFYEIIAFALYLKNKYR